MLRVLSKIIFVILISFLTMTPSAWSSDITDSVVKIFVTSNSMDYYKPWQSEGSQAATGSGFITSGNHIITNAHVVSDQTFIQVRKEADPQKFTAKVVAIGYDCDLALLTVDDPEFFKGVTPFKIGSLPKLQDSVIVIGFPLGGDKLSITEGVVSRIEIIPYTMSDDKLLAVQIDAAINPGNSGGPVINKEGELVGVAMQIISQSQNIGYMIPPPIINHFLDDLKNSNYDGFPTLGIEYVNTENKALREYYQVENKKGGALVSRVIPYTPADEILKEGDVILEVDSIPIGVDGTFLFRENERLIFSHLIHSKQIGDEIKIKLVRSGKEINEKISLKPYVNLIVPPHHFEKPPYYIYGGLIFTILSKDLITTWGQRWWEKAPVEFLSYLAGPTALNKDRKREVVVLLNILPDDLTIGYHDANNEVIEEVNGKTFQSFKEFVSLLENNSLDYTVLKTASLQEIIIKNKDLDAITQDILDRNNIPSKASEDVYKWLSPQE